MTDIQRKINEVESLIENCVHEAQMEELNYELDQLYIDQEEAQAQ